jgi:hypothetical protein
MQDLVVIDGKARGIIARDLVTGEIEDIQHTCSYCLWRIRKCIFYRLMRWVVMQLLLENP